MKAIIHEVFVAPIKLAKNVLKFKEPCKVARDKALYLIKTLNWKNGYHRNDIAFKVIDNL